MYTPSKSIESQSHAQSGFSMLEALVAMLVMSFGMLAISGMQITLGQSSESAKLRSEAVSLAQQKIDDLRSYQAIAATTAISDYSGSEAADLGAGTRSDSPSATSNTTFTRNWTIADPNSMFKTVSVTVAWTDRSGAQAITLNSVIARSDPSSLGTLGVGPGTTVARRPKNRNINVPYPAVTLQGGTNSAFSPPGTLATIVFDNSTGNVLGKCDGTTTTPTLSGNLASATLLAGGGCDNTPGYLLTGYIRFCTSNGCGAANNSFDVGAQYANASNATIDLNTLNPLRLIDTSNQTAGNPTMTCYSARQVTLNNGSVVTDGGQANNQVTARFISYACIVYPVDHDSDADAVTKPIWWGRVVLNPASSWVIGSSNGQYKVCRFSADYDLRGSMSNNEHPLWYRSVTGALDGQNYLVIPQSGSCPTDKPTDPVNQDFVNANTVVHQTIGTSITGAALSFHCKTIPCSGSQNRLSLEPVLLSQPLTTE